MQHTKVIAKQVSSKFFSWHKDINCFTTEASMLPKGFDPCSQVWNDSCDAGFVLVSERTGRELLFTFSHEDKNIEQEVMGWNFKAEPQFNKGLIVEAVDALIIND